MQIFQASLNFQAKFFDTPGRLEALLPALIFKYGGSSHVYF